MADAVEKFDSDSFWKEQDFQTSTRLHLQHWIWSYQLGYTLHPKINVTEGESLRIADVACGNGAWLLDLSREQPGHRYDGFDITAVHFPAAEWLSSKNIKLHVWNAFSELPQEYSGVYDVVHIRTIASAITNNNLEPLLSNLLKMLKPGGYLQWDEQYKLEARSPTADVSAEATKSIVALQAFFSTHMNKLLYDWLDDLSATFTSRGLDVLAHDRTPPCPELGRAWSDNMLTVWRGIVNFLPEQDIPLPPGMGLPEKVSRGSFAQLISLSAAETAKGASAVMEQDVVVGRKSS